MLDFLHNAKCIIGVIGIRSVFLFRTIAQIILDGESNFLMGVVRDAFGEFHLGPAKLLCCPEIPLTKLHTQIRFHNDYILRPADLQREGQQSRMVFIGAVKIPHPADISGRETMDIRVALGQVFRRRDSGTLFRTQADSLANGAVQCHLLYLSCHRLVKSHVAGLLFFFLGGYPAVGGHPELPPHSVLRRERLAGIMVTVFFLSLMVYSPFR